MMSWFVDLKNFENLKNCEISSHSLSIPFAVSAYYLEIDEIVWFLLFERYDIFIVHSERSI